jgi:uracil-DNA glycosylase
MNEKKLNLEFVKLNQCIVDCEKCPRLVAYRKEIARVKRKAYRGLVYWGKPVPGFGDEKAKVLVVGLAPGAHGSNRTGRMFTGDDSGRFLFAALNKGGFANQAEASSSNDGLNLKDLYITAVGRCAPPDNKPTSEELTNCQPYLVREMDLLSNLQGVVALGKIAFDAMHKLLIMRGIPLAEIKFTHGAFIEAQGGSLWLLGSYHPSRQNTQTGRLTVDMFDQIWQRVNEQLRSK